LHAAALLQTVVRGLIQRKRKHGKRGEREGFKGNQ
jgi:hypothetical protein